MPHTPVPFSITINNIRFQNMNNSSGHGIGNKDQFIDFYFYGGDNKWSALTFQSPYLIKAKVVDISGIVEGRTPEVGQIPFRGKMSITNAIHISDNTSRDIEIIRKYFFYGVFNVKGSPLYGGNEYKIVGGFGTYVDIYETLIF